MVDKEAQLRDILTRMEQEFPGVTDRYLSELKGLFDVQGTPPESSIENKADRVQREKQEKQREKEAILRALNEYKPGSNFSIQDLSERTHLRPTKLGRILSTNRESLNVKKYPHEPGVWQKLGESAPKPNRGSIYEADLVELRGYLHDIITSSGGHISSIELLTRLGQRGYVTRGFRAFLANNGTQLGIRELTEDEKSQLPMKSGHGTSKYKIPVYVLK